MKTIRDISINLYLDSDLDYSVEFCEAVNCDEYDGYENCLISSAYILYSKNEEHSQLEVAEVIGTSLETGEDEVLGYLWSELEDGQILSQDGGEDENELVNVIKEFMKR